MNHCYFKGKSQMVKRVIFIIWLILLLPCFSVKALPRRASAFYFQVQSASSPRTGSCSSSRGVTILSTLTAAQMELLKAPFINVVAKETFPHWAEYMPPEAKGLNPKRGCTVISFYVDSKGKATELSFDHLSGTINLDRAAWHAIVASDYPPLPRNIGMTSIKIRIGFDYSG